MDTAELERKVLRLQELLASTEAVADMRRRELEEARETISRLNRRAQSYEAALAEKLEKGRAEHANLGRAAANAAAVMAEAKLEQFRQGLSLAELRQANTERQAEWDPASAILDDATYKGNELAGEVGEACNVLKKLERERRGLRGSRDTVEHLAEELADVIICVDLVAMPFGIDLSKAVRAKFNRTSVNNKLKTML